MAGDKEGRIECDGLCQRHGKMSLVDDRCFFKFCIGADDLCISVAGSWFVKNE